jgi:tRNA(fMet)-specific endonuclease VapC
MARLIDTSVIIELERSRWPLIALDKIAHGDTLALASITASELLAGVHRTAARPQRIQRSEFVESVLSEIPILPFDEAIARTHARLTAELASTGQLIGAYDMIIAATAISGGYILMTHDVNHFQRVPDLEVEVPIW